MRPDDLPAHLSAEKVNRFLNKKKLIEENGITVDIVSIGGSPNMWEVEGSL